MTPWYYAIILYTSILLCCECVDWSAFEVLGGLQSTDSAELVKGLPVQQYWDVQKGSFRIGIIGETLNKSHPQFVSMLTTKVNKAGKLVAVDTAAVDHPTLFMLSLSAVRNLILVDETLNFKMKNFLSGAEGADYNSLQLEFDHISIEELLALRSALLMQERSNNITNQTLSILYNTSQAAMQEKYELKISDLNNMHVRLVDALITHTDVVRMGSKGLHDSLHYNLLKHEASRLELLKAHLYSEHNVSVDNLRRTIDLTMQSLSFRAEKELSFALQEQEFEESQLLDTKTELLQAEVEGVINAFFAELLACARVLAEDPAAVSSALRTAGLLLAVVLILVESVHLVLSVVRKLRGASYLPRIQYLCAAVEADNTFEDNKDSEYEQSAHLFRWCALVANQIYQVQTSLFAATRNNLVLPNILIIGPSGSGKSAVVRRILKGAADAAAASGARGRYAVLRVCGADLQALGNGEATQYLNELVRKHSHCANRLIIVIDDADSIIKQRAVDTISAGGSDAEGASEGGCVSAGCLYSLLTGLREVTASVSLIATARLDVSQVDDALLDRVDKTIVLSLPDTAQRLHYSVCALAQLRCKLQLYEEGFGSGSKEWAPFDPLLESISTDDGRSGACGTREINAALAQALRDVWRTELPSQLVDSCSSCEGLLRGLDSLTAFPSPTITITPSSSSSSSSSSCPETDTPTVISSGDFDVRSADMGEAALLLLLSRDADALLQLLRKPLPALADDSLNILLCLRITLAVSGSWSYRDLKQFFAALNYAMISSDR